MIDRTIPSCAVQYPIKTFHQPKKVPACTSVQVLFFFLFMFLVLWWAEWFWRKLEVWSIQDRQVSPDKPP